MSQLSKAYFSTICHLAAKAVRHIGTTSTAYNSNRCQCLRQSILAAAHKANLVPLLHCQIVLDA